MANKKSNNSGSTALPSTSKMSKQQSDDSEDYSSLKTVLFYCSLIVFLPVATFFLLKSMVLDQLFRLTEMQSNIYSAVGAVVALHLALGLYIYRAYFGVSPRHTKVD